MKSAILSASQYSCAPPMKNDAERLQQAQAQLFDWLEAGEIAPRIDSVFPGAGLGLVVIFIAWQFAQAWGMRVPFREFARRLGIHR